MEKLSGPGKKSLLTCKYFANMAGSQVVFISTFKINAVEINPPSAIFLTLGINLTHFLTGYP
jgi:hypothetical protein